MSDIPGPSATRSIPLAAKVVIGAVLGAVMGVLFGQTRFLFGLGNSDFGQIGLLVIRALKTIAAPLILCAILDSLARTNIPSHSARRLISICLLNVTVAMVIGLTIMNTIHPGVQWQGKLSTLTSQIKPPAPPADTSAKAIKPTLEPLKNIDLYIPKSLLEPFLDNSIISIVLIGLLGGVALRRVKLKQEQSGETSVLAVEHFVEGAYHVLIQMLSMVVRAVPFAVFCVVAKVVGEFGLKVFSILWLFLVIMLLGLAIHSLIYYPFMAWLVGKKRPREYFGAGGEAMITAFSINSSLATIPVTLNCLRKMEVSETSARLAVCVGTNLNHDGITLYEAMAALFLAQATGFHLNIGQQITVILSSIMAGWGVAGIPEAGLVMLPLVLGAAKLPEAAIVQWLPILLAVDWIIARCRSSVNVMNEMMVATVLDRGEIRQ